MKAAVLLVHIALLSGSAHATPVQLERDAHAVTVAAHRWLRPAWRVDIDMRYFATAPAGWERMTVLDWRRSYGGIHLRAAGKPFARVFWAGDQWTGFLVSHEAFEMAVDPSGTGYEVCDPVERSDWAHLVDGVWVSDFMLANHRTDAFGHLVRVHAAA